MRDAEKVAALPTVVVKIRYRKDGYTICLCKTSQTIPLDAMQSAPGLMEDERAFTAVGYGLPEVEGSNVHLTGDWEPNKKYGGIQLKVSDCADNIEMTKEGIIGYLSSGVLKGVGKATAKRIYAIFGEDTLDVLENHPRRLLSVKGISANKLEQIVASYTAHQDIHLLTRLLAPQGVTYRMIVRIRKVLGDGSAAMVKENPYILCKVPGIGFLTADAVALKMGVEPDSEERIKGALFYTIRDAMQAGGHVYIERNTLIEACVGKRGVLASRNGVPAVGKETIQNVLDTMLEEEALVTGADKEHIYLPSAREAELFSAAHVVRMLKYAPAEDQPDWESIIDQVQAETGIQLAEMQRAAVKMALGNQFGVITGGPGSGKTTSLRTITRALQLGHPGVKIALAAPTGRASRRMSEQTGMEAYTLHKLFNIRPNEYSDLKQTPDEYLEADVLIVDEASMMDSALFAEVMHKTYSTTKVLLLGDADQLPSVGPGNVLHDLLSIPETVPHVKLDKVFRQGEDSIIPLNAAKIRMGETDLTYNKAQFVVQRCADEEAGAQMIRRLVERLVEIGELDTAQILCPMRRRGATSINSLNVMLHDIVNPPAPGKTEREFAGALLRVGDKVIQTKNTEAVSNGDIGTITYIAPPRQSGADDDSNPGPELIVQFDALDEPVSYTYDDALELEPAWAITIHKSQGAEYPRVIVPLFKSMAFFLRRNLLYTAITRAKEQVVLVTDITAVEIAIQKEDTSKRNTELARDIEKYMLLAE